MAIDKQFKKYVNKKTNQKKFATLFNKRFDSFMVNTQKLLRNSRDEYPIVNEILEGIKKHKFEESLLRLKSNLKKSKIKGIDCSSIEAIEKESFSKYNLSFIDYDLEFKKSPKSSLHTFEYFTDYIFIKVIDETMLTVLALVDLIGGKYTEAFEKLEIQKDQNKTHIGIEKNRRYLLYDRTLELCDTLEPNLWKMLDVANEQLGIFDEDEFTNKKKYYEDCRNYRNRKTRK